MLTTPGEVKEELTLKKHRYILQYVENFLSCAATKMEEQL
jgi:hypothetical protein